MNIYVGNLPDDATEDQLQQMFAEFGQVERASIIINRATGKPRGYAFVEMPDDGEARQAIEELNSKDYHGRTLTVNRAKPVGFSYDR